METVIKKINTKSIEIAKSIIREGGIVAFPTETVYGLGVSAYKGNSVKTVFEVKGRPNDNPLICHIGRIEDINLCSNNVTTTAMKILTEFSPGPITVVVDKNNKIADEVTAGLDSVGIRIPKPQKTRELLIAIGQPVAAPSANTSTRPSPTTANAVFEDIGGKIPLILDGGSCEVGIESTVVDCRNDIPILLRAGKITKKDIEKVCGKCEVALPTSKVRSPGVKYKHYAPKCDMQTILTNDVERIKKAIFDNKDKKIVVIGNEHIVNELEVQVISLGNSTEEFMHNYFNALRIAEKKADLIILALPFKKENAEGLFNRIEKSCAGNIRK